MDECQAEALEAIAVFAVGLRQAQTDNNHLVYKR